MGDPVMAMDGFHYDRPAIEHWFSTGGLVSPVTGVPFPSQRLTPNDALREQIRKWSSRRQRADDGRKRRHGGGRDDDDDEDESVALPEGVSSMQISRRRSGSRGDDDDDEEGGSSKHKEKRARAMGRGAGEAAMPYVCILAQAGRGGHSLTD